MAAGHAGDFINISSTKYADRSSSQREELEPDKLEVTVIPVDEEPYSKIITIPQSMIGKFDDDNPNLILIHLLSTTLHYHRFTFSIYGQENSTINKWSFISSYFRNIKQRSILQIITKVQCKSPILFEVFVYKTGYLNLILDIRMQIFQR